LDQIKVIPLDLPSPEVEEKEKIDITGETKEEIQQEAETAAAFRDEVEKLAEDDGESVLSEPPDGDEAESAKKKRKTDMTLEEYEAMLEAEDLDDGMPEGISA